MVTSEMRSATFLPAPGRKEARTLQARAPSRRSRLAGCTWSPAKGVAAVIASAPIKASIAWQGRMPGVVVIGRDT